MIRLLRWLSAIVVVTVLAYLVVRAVLVYAVGSVLGSVVILPGLLLLGIFAALGRPLGVVLSKSKDQEWDEWGFDRFGKWWYLIVVAFIICFLLPSVFFYALGLADLWAWIEGLA